MFKVIGNKITEVCELCNKPGELQDNICIPCEIDLEEEINNLELWECGKCGKKVREDNIIQEGNGIDDIRFICVDCQNKRMGVE